MAGSVGGGQLCWLDDPAQWRAEEIQQAWRQALPRGRVNGLYRAPEWFAHRVALRPERKRRLAVYRDGEGVIRGVAPIGFAPYSLRFDLGNGELGRYRFQAVNLLGGEPPLPPEPVVHDELLLGVAQQAPQAECIYLENLHTEGFLWQHCHHSEAVRREFLVHVVDRPTPRHGVRLAASVEDFWQQFGSRRRNEFRRKIKRLKQQGEVEVVRVDRPDQVDDYVTAAAAVTEQSWQGRQLGKRFPDTSAERERLEDLARRGLLRCYLMRVGGRAVAYTLAYQYDGIYYGAETAYDETFAGRRLAPSSVLHLRLIEDMIRDPRQEYLDFGSGDYPYKRVFGNDGYDEASLLLLRRTLPNRLVAFSHSTFRRSVHQAKRLYFQVKKAPSG